MELLSKSVIRQIQKLRDSTERYLCSRFWAEGQKTILTLMEGGLFPELIVTDDKSEIPQMMHSHRDRCRFYTVASRDVNKIKSTHSFPGMGAVFPIPSLQIKYDRCLFLCGLNDPGNLGTLIRTAAWYDVSAVFVDRQSVDPFHEKVVRSAMGAHAFLPLVKVDDFHSSLKSLRKTHGWELLGADTRGKDIPSSNLNDRWGLILGSESHGVPPSLLELCDHVVSLPKRGFGESLNVAVAGGILIHLLKHP